MKFDQIETPDELKLYLDSPFVYKSTVKCFYHYTTLDSLAEIIHGSSLKFSSLATMNDILEENVFGKYCNEKFFCLMVSKTENFGMWAMYGGLTKTKEEIDRNPKAINVKICFPASTLKKLCEQGVRAHLVAYADFAGAYKDSETEDANKGYLYRCGTKKTSQFFNCDKEQFAGYLKDLAWRYESELRLCLKKENPNDNKPSTKLFAPDFLKDLKVVPSPLISKEECEIKFREVLKQKDYELGIDINNLFVVNDYYGRVRPKDLEILKKR